MVDPLHIVFTEHLRIRGSVVGLHTSPGTLAAVQIEHACQAVALVSPEAKTQKSPASGETRATHAECWLSLPA